MVQGVVIDSVPTDVRQAARDAFDRYRRDVPVADLVYDSLVYAPEGGSQARTLRYSRATHTMTVEVDDADGAELLRLRVTGPWRVPADLLVTCGDWTCRRRTEADGTASVAEVPSGLLSVTIDAGELGSVQTAHVRI